jgi:hypothetical protein
VGDFRGNIPALLLRVPSLLTKELMRALHMVSMKLNPQIHMGWIWR